MTDKIHQLGDQPIEAELRAKMGEVARRIGRALSEVFGKKWGFILMVFPFEDHAGRCNYISNANRDDVVLLMKEQVKRFEGQPDITGHG